MAQLTSSLSSLSFGDRQVGSLSPGQTIIVNPSSYTDTLTYALSGTNAGDFIQANSTVDFPEVTVAFQPRFPGTKSALLTITDTTTNDSLAIPLTGNAVLTGTFQIVAAFSGKVLDLASDSAADGTPVEQYALDGLPQQGWKFVPTDSGYYEIVNSVTGKVLDVTGASTENGAQIQEYSYWGGLNQQWRITPIDDVHYQIVNRLSGDSLDVTDGSTLDGTPIQQWTYVGDGQQLWAIVLANPYCIANVLSGDVLDVLNGSTANEALIQQWAPDGYPQQEWQVIPLPDQGNSFTPFHYPETLPAECVIVNLLTGKALDVVGGSTSNQAQIDQSDVDGSASQLWNVLAVPGSTTFYQVINQNSQRVLDDTNASTSNGTLIQQYGYWGGSNQQWQFVLQE